MKVLRDALIKEKQEKDIISKAKQALEKENERVKSQFQEKENYLLKLKDEVADLQTKLQIERKKNDSSQPKSAVKTEAGAGAAVPGQESHITEMLTSSISNLSGMFGIKKGAQPNNEEVQKLQNELNYSKKQLEVLQEKYRKSEAAVAQLKKDAGSQSENSEKKLKEVEADLESRIQAYRELNKKFEELDNLVAGLRRDKDRLEQNVSRLRSENETLVHERDETEKENREKVRMVQELNEVCSKMEAELSNQVQKNKDLKIQLEEAEMNMQCFDLKKSGKVMDVPALFMMRKNVNDEYIIEIESSGEKLLLYPQVVQSFGPIKETEDRFYFDYKDTKGEVIRDVFQVEDRKKILRSLKSFVRLSDMNSANLNNKATGAIKEKNLLSQMVSFFNN